MSQKIKIRKVKSKPKTAKRKVTINRTKVKQKRR